MTASFLKSGQFTRLLPSLDVVAVSQAPSPESNPNPPLPVIATVGHYPTVKLMDFVPSQVPVRILLNEKPFKVLATELQWLRPAALDFVHDL